MRSNEKVSQDSRAFPPACPVCSPSAARQKMSFTGKGLYTDFVAVEESVTLLLIFEMDAEFGIHDIANH